MAAVPTMTRTSGSCFDKTGRSHNPNDIEFMLYHEPSENQVWTKLIFNKKRSLKSSRWNMLKKTKVLIHGLEQNVDAGFPQILKNAYMENGHRNDHNVIIVNWSALAARNDVLYFEVLKRIKLVDKRVADFLVWVGRCRGLDLDKNVHIVGEGVGVHVAGLVGSHVIAKKMRIGRITGLDPKFAGYLTYYNNKRLEKTDADFVDVYHTDETYTETYNMFGHVDFFINRKIALLMKNTPEKPRNYDSNPVAHTIFAQTIRDGPSRNNVTSVLGLVDPNSASSDPVHITVGEYCLPGTNGWFDITYYEERLEVACQFFKANSPQHLCHYYNG